MSTEDNKSIPEEEPGKRSLNFIEEKIEKDLNNNKNNRQVHTRFPPEPNGFLHIGHAKSIVLNFGLAKEYNGKCNLRFDDTNPIKESTEYVDSIKEDIHWLGYDWEERLYYASDYFEQLYEMAEKLIKDGKAFVCDLSQDQIAEYRGTPTEPGIESPYRNRSIEENLDLFRRMRAGEFPDGSRMLRAKIDMSSPNMHLRDPIMYRIKRSYHHRTGYDWCIYPMYDFAHGQSDYIESITHSLCTLEFEVHRPLYDWFLDNLVEEGEIRPQQIEFARLNLSYTIVSKRKLLELVENDYVDGWDDPRMPTISGFRRRGYTPDAIKNFVEKVGIAKRDNVIDVALLEHSIREDLNKKAPRVMAVLDPVKVIIDNYPDDTTEDLELVNNPEDESMGSRKVPFSKEVYIEKKDFMEDPPKKFFRMAPGREVRLKGAYVVKCDDYKKDDQGNITEIHCTYDPQTKSGADTSGKKVKGTLHWVSAPHAFQAEVRLYDRLFNDPAPSSKDEDFKAFINPDSLKVFKNCYLEPVLKDAEPEDKFQFQRIGYFCVDRYSEKRLPVFNQTVTLKDTWAKKEKQQQNQKKKG
ncbi:MAG: glutamine--tRNA ligase/YqeY domain fusion protein [Bacteroidales bacterium]|nr:glutamine--tRNA ligase/YqeY domain fusion protein [Bacteroidales bacterium]